MVASRNGLAEDQIIDILSRDTSVMLDFRNRNLKWPDVQTLPPIIWLRLYQDIDPFLSSKISYGTPVISFFHNQFEEVIRTDYLFDSIYYHNRIAQYFKDQRIDNQKIDELPWNQICGEDWEGLKDTLTNVELLSEVVIEEDECMLSKKGEWLGYWRLIDNRYNKIRMYEKSLEDYCTQDVSPLNIALAYNDVGAFFFYSQDYVTTERFWRKALTLRETDGTDPQLIIRSLLNLGAVLTNQGYYNIRKLEEAETLIRLALDLAKTNLGEEHSDTVITLINLAGIYGVKVVTNPINNEKQRENLNIAKQLLNQALEISKRTDSRSVYIYDNLSTISYYANEYHAGVDYGLLAMEQYKRLSLSESIETANIKHTLGNCYLKLKQYDIGENYIRDAITLQEKYYGSFSEPSFEARISLLELFLSKKDPQAITEIKRIYRGISKFNLNAIEICFITSIMTIIPGISWFRSRRIILPLYVLSLGIGGMIFGIFLLLRKMLVEGLNISMVGKRFK